MKWVKSFIAPEDVISSLSYGPARLLACASWDGTVTVNTPLETAAKMQFSRPVFSVCWESNKARILVSSGEYRIAAIDVERQECIDLLETKSLILDVKPVGTSTYAAVSRHGLYIGDTRTPHTNAQTNNNVAGTCLDVLKNSMLVVNQSGAEVFDYRHLTNPVSVYRAGYGFSPQRAVWVTANTYALANTQSQIAVVGSDGTLNYIFKSNRRADGTPTPIYSLARRLDAGETPALATGGGDGCVYLWDVKRKRQLSKASFPLSCTALAFSAANDVAVGLSTDQWSTTPSQYAQKSKAKVMVAANSVYINN